MVASKRWLREGVGSIKTVKKMHKLDVGDGVRVMAAGAGSRQRSSGGLCHCGMWSRMDAARSRSAAWYQKVFCPTAAGSTCDHEAGAQPYPQRFVQ